MIGAAVSRQTNVLRQAQVRLADLERYLETVQAQSDEPTGVPQLHDKRTFLERLCVAVEGQRDIVAAESSELSKLRARWVEERRRGDVYRKLADRAADDVRLGAERLEQKLQDENALRRHVPRRTE